MRKKLYVSQFDNPYIQENFKTIGELFNTNPFLKGEWKFLEFNVNSSGSNVLIPHTLNFTPKDAILLSQIDGTLSFNYNLFDSKFMNLNITVSTSPARFRVLVGRYTEDSVNV